MFEFIRSMISLAKRRSLTEVLCETDVDRENQIDVKQFVMECDVEQFQEKMKDRKFRNILLTYLVSKDRYDLIEILEKRV